jgi:hypothetical protein
MAAALKRSLLTVPVGLAIGLAAPVAQASAASLKLKAPSTISASKSFRIVASGRGNGSSNFLAVFFTLRSKCAATYAAANNQSHTILLQSFFVGRTFKVKLAPIHGGERATGRFCGYLYPRASGSAWAYKKPEASASRQIKFT